MEFFKKYRLLYLMTVFFCLFCYNSSAFENGFYNTYPVEQKIVQKSEKLVGKFKTFSILPESAKGRPNFSFYEMSDWSQTRRTSFRKIFQNSFGDFGGNIVDMVFHIDFQSGGQYRGRGKYINALKISVEELFVAGGLDLDVSVRALSLSNIGTALEPIPSVLIEVKYLVVRMFKAQQTSDIFWVAGDGNFELLSDSSLE